MRRKQYRTRRQVLNDYMRSPERLRASSFASLERLEYTCTYAHKYLASIYEWIARVNAAAYAQITGSSK